MYKKILFIAGISILALNVEASTAIERATKTELGKISQAIDVANAAPRAGDPMAALAHAEALRTTVMASKLQGDDLDQARERLNQAMANARAAIAGVRAAMAAAEARRQAEAGSSEYASDYDSTVSTSSSMGSRRSSVASSVASSRRRTSSASTRYSSDFLPDEDVGSASTPPSPRPVSPPPAPVPPPPPPSYAEAKAVKEARLIWDQARALHEHLGGCNILGVEGDLWETTPTLNAMYSKMSGFYHSIVGIKGKYRRNPTIDSYFLQVNTYFNDVATKKQQYKRQAEIQPAGAIDEEVKREKARARVPSLASTVRGQNSARAVAQRQADEAAAQRQTAAAAAQRQAQAAAVLTEIEADAASATTLAEAVESTNCAVHESLTPSNYHSGATSVTSKIKLLEQSVREKMSLLEGSNLEKARQALETIQTAHSAAKGACSKGGLDAARDASVATPTRLGGISGTTTPTKSGILGAMFRSGSRATGAASATSATSATPPAAAASASSAAPFTPAPRRNFLGFASSSRASASSTPDAPSASTPKIQTPGSESGAYHDMDLTESLLSKG